MRSRIPPPSADWLLAIAHATRLRVDLLDARPSLSLEAREDVRERQARRAQQGRDASCVL